MKNQTNHVTLMLTAFVLLLTGMMSISNALFTTRAHIKPITAQEKQRRDFIRSLVKKTGGDYNKLTPNDSEKLNEVTKGFGKMAFDEVTQHG